MIDGAIGWCGSFGADMRKRARGGDWACDVFGLCARAPWPLVSAPTIVKGTPTTRARARRRACMARPRACRPAGLRPAARRKRPSAHKKNKKSRAALAGYFWSDYRPAWWLDTEEAARNWFSFWFLGAGGRLPKVQRGRVYCAVHHHQEAARNSEKPVF